MPRILRKHQDIRDWAIARGGAPMLEDVPDGSKERHLLQLTFGQHALNADHNEGPDPLGGFVLVGWDEWFAVLDAEKLAIEVNDEEPGSFDNRFEFVPR